MSDTRELILKFMLSNPRCTINDLAEAVEINPISVRHHITKLEADGVVGSEEERYGVGRPRRVYFLTEKGMESFPTRYLKFSTYLLEQLKGTLSSKAIEAIFEQIGSDIITDELDQETELEALPWADRLELTRQFLSNEGFNVEVEQQEGGVHIKETSCPYMHIGKEHREICIVDETMIATMLGVPVEKTHCILDGDAYCAYIAPNSQQG